jgi:hypothetical protein
MGAQTNGIPFRVTEHTQYRPSFGFPKGGIFMYRLDASNNEIRAYVPTLSAGTIVILVAVNVTNAVYVQAKNAGPINGSTTFEIELGSRGDALILSADMVAETWRQHTTNIEVS